MAMAWHVIQQTQTRLQFSDMPLELLPSVLQHINRPHVLAMLSLVNQAFHKFVTPLLYREIFIFPWYKNWKEKTVLLFDTLARYPRLARYVRRLELREFPRWMIESREFYALQGDVILGISHCGGLRTCVWTRDGTLRDDILDAIREHCVILRDLEVNGNAARYYDASGLTGITGLERISLIMPDRAVIALLPGWVATNGESLKTLSFTCQSTPLFTDDVLGAITAGLQDLHHLHLVGTPRITYNGIATLAAASPNLSALSIEGFDIDVHGLSEAIRRSDCLHNLSTLSVTIPTSGSFNDFFNGLLSTLSHCPLREFQIWRPGGDMRKAESLPIDFVESLLHAHGFRLTKFAVQRLETTMKTIELVCRHCPQLEQLFLVIGPCDLDVLATHLSRLPKLHTIHLSYTYTNKTPILHWHTNNIVSLVRRCPSTLRLIGLLTRVLEIRRTWNLISRNPVVWADEPDIILEPYSGPGIPEAFLVMKA